MIKQPRTLDTEDDVRDLAIRLTDALVEARVIPDCLDTNEESEFSTQDLLHSEISRFLGRRRFNHLLDVGFSVVSPCENWADVPKSEIIAALKARAAYLESNPDEAADAFGYSGDTYEEQSR